MFLFFGTCSSLRPLVVLPPLYGTNLFINYSNIEAPWYCPESLNNEIFWLAPKFLLPPLHKCLLNYMSVFWDANTSSYTNWKNVTIYTDEVGKPDTVKYVDSGIMGYHFFETFATLLSKFHVKGWQSEIDIFAAPYDWRVAPTGLGEFWKNLKSLIERAYNLNNHTKVTIFGYSCGGFTTQQFLSKHVTGEWKNKYIDRVVLLAPSFGGVGTSFEALWTKRLNVVPFLTSPEVTQLIDHLPVIMSHLPNHHVFKDNWFIRSEHDHTFTAEELPRLLIEHGKLTGDSIDILKRATSVSTEVPVGLDVPTFIIFNSGVETPHKLHFKKGWSKPPTVIPGEGDGTILSDSLYWACENWSTDKAPVMCIDTYRNSPDFQHTPLTSNPYIIEKVIELLTTDEWTHHKGRKITRAPYIVIENSTYKIRSDIREEKVIYHE